MSANTLEMTYGRKDSDMRRERTISIGRRMFVTAAVMAGALFLWTLFGTGSACAAGSTVEVSTQEELVSAVAGASTDPGSPTRIVMTKSIEMGADTPVVSQAGTYAVLEGASAGIKLTPSADWTAMTAVPAADHVPGLLEVNGRLDVLNLTIDASAASKGVRCVGVGAQGELYLEQVSVTGSKLKRVGGLGIYTLGRVVMGDKACVEGITADTTESLTGVGVCVGYHKATKSQGSLVMQSGSAVRDNASVMRSGGMIDGTGIYAQGPVEIFDGASVSGNTNVKVSVGGIGIYARGGSAAYPAVITMRGGSISDNIDINNIRTGMQGANGAGVCLDSNASFVMEGGVITGNRAYKGGGGLALLSALNCRADLYGGSISGNRSYARGGGIYNGGGDLEVHEGFSVTDNVNELDFKSAEELGMPTYDENEGYHDGQGGGIFNEGTLVISGGIISGNHAVSTRTVRKYTFGQGGGVYNAGTMTMTGGTITDNEARTLAGNGGPAGSGGGIAVRGGALPGRTNLYGGTISGNSADGCGADIWAGSEYHYFDRVERGMILEIGPGVLALGDPALSESHLKAGSIVLDEGASLLLTGTIKGAELTLDILSAGEGTVAAEGGDYTVTAEDARALVNPDGKHIYLLMGGRVVVGEEREDDYVDINLGEASDIEDQTFTGEGICPEPKVSLDGRTLKKNRDYQLVYENNIHVSTGESGAEVRILGIGDFGGEIRKRFKIIPRDMADCTVKPVRARLYTGSPVTPRISAEFADVILAADEDYTLEFADNTDIGTASFTAKGKGDFTGSYSGTFDIVSREGALIVSDETALLSTIAGAAGSSSQESPVKIYVSGQIGLSAPVSIPAGSFVELTGEDEDAAVKAGASFEGESLVTVSGGLTVTELTLTAEGGASARAVKVAGGGTLRLQSGAVLTGGTAVLGRSVFNEGTFLMSDGIIEGNDEETQSRQVCGAVYNAGRFTMAGGMIRGNRAVKGGALYNASGASASLTGGILSDNMVTGSVLNQPYGAYGGAVCNDEGAELEIGPVRIRNNKSTQFGGGIANGGKLTLDGTRITGNQAELGGGGLFSFGTVTIRDAEIAGNSADSTDFASIDPQLTRRVPHASSDGGGIYVQCGTVTMEKGQIHDNLAEARYSTSNDYIGDMGNGGGVYVANSENAARFVMKGGSITGNTAKSRTLHGLCMGQGGGVYVLGGEDAETCFAPGTFEMTGGVIEGNSSSDGGDDVLIGNSYEQYGHRSPDHFFFRGSALALISGGAVIGGESGEGIYLTSDTIMSVTGALTGSVRVTAADGGRVLIAEGADGYEMTETDAASVANSTPVRTAEFADGMIALVPQKDLSEVIQAEMDREYVWTGSAIRPKPVIMIKKSGKEAAESDYTLIYSKTVEPGSYSVGIRGEGRYREYRQISEDYAIVPAPMSAVTVRTIPDQAYTGKAVKYLPANGIITYNGRTLLRNTDYTISYKNNKAIGKATMTLTGMDHFTGTRAVTFKIVPKKGAVKKAVSRKKAQLTVIAKKDTGVTGYEFATAKNAKFTKGKKTASVKKYSSKGYTFKKLTSGKVYYVRVRTYKTVSGKKYCGAWSAVKKLRIK